MTDAQSRSPNRPTEPKPLTEDEVLLESRPPREAVDLHKASDSWRALRILGEFVWGFENLADVSGGVSIFGSARATPANCSANCTPPRLFLRPP